MKFYQFNKRIDRRFPTGKGDYDMPVERQNLLSRDGHLKSVSGTEALISDTLTEKTTWMARYYTIEIGQISPKTFAYTIDGKLWLIDEINKTATEIKDGLNKNAYPVSQLFKTGDQTKLYLVDGKDLYEYDGNNDNLFNKVDITDVDGNSIEPIDVIEHRDRLWLISLNYLFVSKNLEPSVFNDATDSFQGVIGSGRGRNLSVNKIEDTMFILNTSGIFMVAGDVISAVASTWEIRLVEQRNIMSSRSASRAEKSIIFLGEQSKNIELWSFDGSATKLLSYTEKLTDFINPYRMMLDKAVAGNFDSYYMISVVETGQTENNIEFWYDTLEDKIEIVKGRNVSCYMTSDPTQELPYQLLGRSDVNKIMTSYRTNNSQIFNFDGTAIEYRLRTKDIYPIKGTNVRFTNFYVELEPIGDHTILFRYLLDSRLSNPTDSSADWSQNLKGESKGLGFIAIANQNQFTDRVKPKIDYARGESIAFEVYGKSDNGRVTLQSISFDYIKKAKKKGKVIGQ